MLKYIAFLYFISLFKQRIFGSYKFNDSYDYWELLYISLKLLYGVSMLHLIYSLFIATYENGYIICGNIFSTI